MTNVFVNSLRICHVFRKNIISFQLKAGFKSETQTIQFRERWLLGFSAQQMYNIVSNVNSYQDFLPACQRSRLYKDKSGVLVADLVVGYFPITESYTSKLTLQPPNLVKSVCQEGIFFKNLESVWKFVPDEQDHLKCLLEFSISFQPRNSLDRHVSQFFYDHLVKQMSKAFLRRATQLYGKPSILPKVLPTK